MTVVLTVVDSVFGGTLELLGLHLLRSFQMDRRLGDYAELLIQDRCNDLCMEID